MKKGMNVKKVNKDYRKIIRQLESLYAHASDMVRTDSADDIWKKDMEALQEAIDIVYDYEKAIDLGKLHEKLLKLKGIGKMKTLAIKVVALRKADI